jgi:shikimate kinase
MIYFIIGYKNSGKTTFGRKLAERLNMEFTDLDEYIEEKEGDTIPNIFVKAGEAKFRQMEWEALQEVVKRNNIVVATGGGVPCNCDSMSIMEKTGKVIYLKRDNKLLVQRLKKAVHDRPIVKGKNEDELEQYISDLRQKCEHHYLRAHYIIDDENPDMDKVLSMLKG